MFGLLFVASYGLCCVAFLGLAAHTLVTRTALPLRNPIVLACACTAVWAGCASASFAIDGSSGLVVDLAECARDIAWLGVLTMLLTQLSAPSETPRRRLLTTRALIPVGIVATALQIAPHLGLAAPAHPTLVVAQRIMMTLLAVLGLLVLEELVARGGTSARWGFKHLCIALATLFIFDLIIYPDALLLQGLPGEFLMMRGAALAFTVPLLALSIARMKSWRLHPAEGAFNASRASAVQSIALLGSGMYLLAMAALAFIVRQMSDKWGPSLQILLVVGGLLLMVVVLSSGRIKSQLKILVYKGFFTYKYDYREEWRRFTGMMSAHHMLSTGERIVHSLTNMMDSPAGALWLWNRHDDVFVPGAAWNYQGLRPSESAASSFVAYLANTNWIVEVDVARRSPKDYPGLALPQWILDHTQAWLIVPISHRGELLAFLILAHARTPRRLDWEDRDLLKTAAAHAASYLAAEIAADEASDARKIEEFNRRFAFVVHDVKNVVGQMSLMLDNSDRFGDDPEFQRDIVETARNSVARLKKLLEQLAVKRHQPEARPTGIDLGAVAGAVVKRWQKASANVVAEFPAEPVVATAIEDNVTAVLDLIIDNGISASGPGGQVVVRLRRDSTRAVLEIEDDGPGMDMDFVRNELFRPLRTTKGTGYGIGAYQSQHLIREMGGQLEVDSAPNKGTTMRILLPLAPVMAEDAGAMN